MFHTQNVHYHKLILNYIKILFYVKYFFVDKGLLSG